MSKLSVGEPDECSVDVSLRTDKARQDTTQILTKKETGPSSISFAQVSSVASLIRRFPHVSDLVLST